MGYPARGPADRPAEDPCRFLVPLTERLCADMPGKRGVPVDGSSLRLAVIRRLEDLSRVEISPLVSERDRADHARLQDGLRRLAEALRHRLPDASSDPSPAAMALAEDILDAILRAWILEGWPGSSAAITLLFANRHLADIARGILPFLPQLMECGILERHAEEGKELYAIDFLGLLLLHLEEDSWRRLRQWDPLKGPMGPWLKQVARQKAYDEIRRHHRALSFPWEEPEDTERLPEPQEPEGEILPEGRFFLEELARIWQENSLDQTSWTILILAYIEGRTDEQIARAMGVRRETINRRKQAALRQAFCALWQRHSQDALRETPDAGPIQRVVERYCQGCSIPEIATGLNMADEEVRACLEKARKLLFEILSP